jgi:glycosyltransferase involved in cell wall biosynthesis
LAERALVVALGELQPEVAEAAARNAVRAAHVEWLDRSALRQHPVRTVWRLVRTTYADAVLVAPDLRVSRLKITSLVLAIVRARRRWRVDASGVLEVFAVGAHLRRYGLGMARHLLACGGALVGGEVALSVLNWLIRPRCLKLTQPRRVLYLRSQLWIGLPGGGSVAHTAGVIGGLARKGVDVQVLSSDVLAGVFKTAPSAVVAPEVWFDGHGRELEELAYNVAFLLAAIQQVRRLRPDAIYQRHTAFNVTGALLSRLFGRPLVLEFNSSEVWKGRYWGGLYRARAAELVEQINLRAADRVVVVSRTLCESLVQAGLPRDKIVVNPNGVDPYQFRPDIDGSEVRRRYGLGSNLVIGFSGTFGLWHGIPTLAAAIPRVLERDPEVRFLLVGDGPLGHLVDGLGERVTRAGLVPHAEMPAHLAACDVLVSPHGRQADGGEFFGSPTKLYEYMAAGRPIVASAVGQIAEVLDHERTALLVPPDDVDALCDAIGRLVEYPCLRTRFGTAAREQALAEHTWQQNAERLLASLDHRP